MIYIWYYYIEYIQINLHLKFFFKKKVKYFNNILLNIIILNTNLFTFILKFKKKENI